MKFANDYLRELLGTDVCNLEFNAKHIDRWEYNCLVTSHGGIEMYITFETNSEIKQERYGSLMVVHHEAHSDRITHYYKMLCLYGKETQELILHLGGKA